jgi:hypothetical protein
MRILLDQGTPASFGKNLSKHDVSTAYEMGWAGLDNGALLRSAEQSFDILITTDQNLRYQENLRGRRLAVLVLPTIDLDEDAAAPCAHRRGGRKD